MSCPSFTIGIVAHEARLDAAKALADTVAADAILVDDAALRLGCEANHRRCWAELAGSGAQWAVVLEDDAVPVPGFRDQLTAALTVAPAPFVSLYLGRGFPRQWQKRIGETIAAATPETCWAITSGYMLHAVGIAVRSELVPAMLAHLDRAIGVPVDQAIGQHARNTAHQVAYTLPSLVDHADGPTIHIHQDGQPRPPGRTAWTAGTRPQWTDSSIQMG